MSFLMTLLNSKATTVPVVQRGGKYIKVHYVSKRLWTPDHYVHTLGEHLVPDLFPVCCYNELHSSVKAFHRSISEIR